MSKLRRSVAGIALAGGLSSLCVPFAGAVVGGDPAPDDVETRSIVGLQIPTGEADMVDNCTGTVIAPEWILTAEHCVKGKDSLSSLYVVANGTTYGGTTLKIDKDEKIRKFNRQDFGKSQVHRPSDGTDLALIKLPRAITGVSPATLASSSKSAGVTGRIYGWGAKPGTTHELGEKMLVAPSMIGFNGLPHDFAELGSDLAEFEKYASGTYYYSTQTEPAQVVQGDSGGPLMIDGKVSGVTSQLVSDLDTGKTIGVLSTDVGAKADWIRETVGDAKASRHVDVAAGIGGVENGEKFLPFMVANLGSDEVSEVNVEVSPPEGEQFPVGSEILVSKSSFASGEDAAPFEVGERVPLDFYTPATNQDNVSRSFTARVPVNLGPGEGVQLRVRVPAGVEGGSYRVIAYPVPGFRPAMFDLDSTSSCDIGTDSDNCASVEFRSGEVEDVLVNERGFDTRVKFEGASGPSGGSGAVESSVAPAKPSEKLVPSSTAKPKPSTSAKPKPSSTAKPKPSEKPADTAKPKPSEKPADTAKPSEKPADTAKPSEKPADTAKPSEKPADTAKPKPSEKPADTANSAESPADTAEKPVDTANPAENPASPAHATKDPESPSVADNVRIPEGAVIDGTPDTQPAPNAQNDTRVEIPDTDEGDVVLDEAPAAAQRILADTGVTGLASLAVLGGLTLLVGAVVSRRRR